MSAPDDRERRGAILVTGASSGIGAAIAEQLALRGYRVGCFSRRGSTPGVEGCVALRGDVTDAAALGAALDELAGADPLVGLVNCAGRHAEGPSLEFDAAELRAILETNFVAALEASRLAHPHLVAAGGGLIVNIGSFYDRLGVPGHLAYAASKAALASMTRSLAVEWATDGIRLVNVAPGYVVTDLNAEFFADEAAQSKLERRIPVRRVGRAEEVGSFVAALFALEIGYLTGTTVYIDGAHGVAL